MITTKKTLLIIMVFTIWFSSVAFCDQTVQQECGLQFEVSQQNVRWRQGMPRPTYMAVLYLKNYSPHIRDFGGFRRSLEGIVSPEQSRFMRMRPPSGPPGRFIKYGSLSDKGHSIVLYGVSEKDVRIMVKSLIKWANEQAEAELEKTKSDLENRRKQKTRIENLINRERKEKKEIEAKLPELKKSVPYQSIEDAHEIIQELNKVLQLGEVEIVGIEAKLSMIKQQYEKIENQSISDFLFQIRLTQEIELAGALARKNAAQSAHKKALDFSNLVEQAEALPQRLEFNQKRLIETQSKISRFENNLDNPPDGMKPIELADSKVTIYPIEDE